MIVIKFTLYLSKTSYNFIEFPVIVIINMNRYMLYWLSALFLSWHWPFSNSLKFCWLLVKSSFSLTSHKIHWLFTDLEKTFTDFSQTTGYPELSFVNMKGVIRYIYTRWWLNPVIEKHIGCSKMRENHVCYIHEPKQHLTPCAIHPVFRFPSSQFYSIYENNSFRKKDNKNSFIYIMKEQVYCRMMSHKPFALRKTIVHIKLNVSYNDTGSPAGNLFYWQKLSTQAPGLGLEWVITSHMKQSITVPVCALIWVNII